MDQTIQLGVITLLCLIPIATGKENLLLFSHLKILWLVLRLPIITVKPVVRDPEFRDHLS